MNTPFNRSVSFMYDNITNTIIGDVKRYSFADELKRNISIQTILNKQIGIVGDAELKLYNSTSGKDPESNNKIAKTFFDLLQNPNCQPSPNDWDDILYFILKQYTYYGIAGLIIVSDGEFSPNNMTSMLPASNIQYQNSMGNYYNASVKFLGYNQTFRFEYDENGMYKARNGNKEMILIVFGEYNYDLCQYQSPFISLRDVILVQNYTLEASKTFYQNSCRPSSIITVNYADKSDSGLMRANEERERIAKIVAEFKTDLKGAENTGKTIMVSDMEVKVSPLSIPTNADDTMKQLDLTKDIIYSYIAGGSRAVIEGQTEYSNNALEKAKLFHDGTFSYVERVVINPLNQFLQKYLELFDTRSLDRKNTYLALDKSGVEFYKRYLEELASLKYKNNEIGRADLYEIQHELREVWAGIEKPTENKLLVEMQRTNNLVG